MSLFFLSKYSFYSLLFRHFLYFLFFIIKVYRKHKRRGGTQMNILADVKLGEKKTISSDEKIVQAFQLGDEVAFNLLVKKYEYLVCSKVKVYFLLGGDREDLLQEAKLGLYKAAR